MTFQSSLLSVSRPREMSIWHQKVNEPVCHRGDMIKEAVAFYDGNSRTCYFSNVALLLLLLLQMMMITE